MPTVKLKTPGKLNLALDVVGKREDGYHLLKMIMQSVNLYNTVTIRTLEGKETYLYCTNSEVPCDGRNLAWQAANQFFSNTGIEPCGLDITLEKSVPMEAGMGGGSADAAAALVGLNRLFQAGLTQEELCGIGVKVGADVPFCIAGGTLRCEGIGELLTPVPPLPDCYILLAKPYESMRTVDCFNRYDTMTVYSHPDLEGMELALAAQDLRGVAERLHNVLEQVVLFGSVFQIKKKMLNCGALGASMTGSGTAVFGLFDDKKLAKRCLKKLMGDCKSVFLTRPSRGGAEIVSYTE